MSKFIDLEETITREAGAIRTEVHRVLRWLDEHPEKVPGRTITESQLNEVQVRCGFSGTEIRVNHILRDLGIVFVPDPKPTNAELLRELMGIAPSSLNRGQLADWLDSRGVKATGDDDE